MEFSKISRIAAALIAVAGLTLGAAAPVFADSAANCRAETEPNVAPCIQKIDASLQNPSVCAYMAAGQAPAEYLRCYSPMVLCGGISKADAQAKANADAAAGIKNAKAQGYCK
jgi:hypothetical protein